MNQDQKLKIENRIKNTKKLISGYEQQRDHATSCLEKNKYDKAARFRLKEAEKELQELNNKLLEFQKELYGSRS